MARLNNAMGSSAGPSLILPGRNTYYSNNNNSSSSSNNNSNSNMGSRPSLPPPTRSSSSAQTVIDLTDSPPPQEGGFNPTTRAQPHAGGPSRGGSNRAEIIDVDALPDSPILHSRRSYAGWNFSQMAEDTEVVFGRPSGSRILGGGPSGRAQPHHQHGQGWASRPRPMPVEPSVLYSRIPDRSADRNVPFQQRFYQELEDPILGQASRVGRAMPELHGVGVPRNMTYAGGVGGGARSLSMRAAEDMMQRLVQAFPAGRHWQVPDDIFNFQAPGQLDYRQRAPGIIREDSPVIDAARVRNIDYKAPPPAKEGFTRSPKESDILVCASCSSELGAGENGPVGNEVWAAKCGHVSRSFLRVSHLTSPLRRSNCMSSAIAVLVSLYSARFLLQNRQEAVGRHDQSPRIVSLVVK